MGNNWKQWQILFSWAPKSLRTVMADTKLKNTCSLEETMNHESESCSVMSVSLQALGLYTPWNSLGQNTGVGSLSLLQRIFPTQGSNPGLPHCRWIFYQPSHQGNPRILEWVAYPFSRGSSQPRDWTRVSRIAGGFFTSWACSLEEKLWPT